MNQGLKIATGKYLTIINPDVIIKHGIDSMINFMDNNPMIGAIAPQIINAHGEIQDSCRDYVSIYRLTCRYFKRILTNKTVVLTRDFNYSKIQTVDWII